MPDTTAEPTAMLLAVRAATANLLKSLDEAGWSNADLAAPTLCDGWTRAHILTHLARNADGITATLSGALRGEVVRRYPGGNEQRAADIEAGASRPLSAVVADLTDSASRLDRVFAAVTEAGGWKGMTEREHLAHEWPSRRLCEIELHRVDLDAGYSPREWPAVLVSDLLPYTAASLTERTTEPVLVVVDAVETDSVVPSLAGQSWGDPDGRVVTAPDWALLAWLTGRGTTVLDALPDQPRLSEWR